MFALVPLVVLVCGLGVVVLVVWALRRNEVQVDIRQVYFYLVALVTFLSVFFSTLTLVNALVTLALPDLPTPTGVISSDALARQQIAATLGTLSVALPVWWLHWSSARQHALATQRLLLLRIYFYALAVIALLVAVIAGGIAGSGIVRALLDLVDFSNVTPARLFWRDELQAVANLLVALLVWFYHWRAAERARANENLEGLHL